MTNEELLQPNGVQKFVLCARKFKEGQMKMLRGNNFFTLKEVREGLKRYIHITYIEEL